MKAVRYDEDADEELIDEIARYELQPARSGTGRSIASRSSSRARSDQTA
jgi:hypothetical protein